MSKTLVELEAERLAWSLETFTEATPISSLRKAESEIKEIEQNILTGKKDPMEYADAIMCILDAAGRDGVSVESILEDYERKIAINKARKWVKNPDNSYSHVKEPELEGELWDESRFAGIHDVLPAFAGNINNYPDWKASVEQIMRADGFSEHHVTIHDWDFARDEYFNQGCSAIEAHKMHYYEE